MGMSEKSLQRAVMDMARVYGFLVYHVPDSRHVTSAGFPDLVLLHTKTGRLLWVELKSDTGRIRPEQHLWINRLSMRHEVYVWRPTDLLSGSIKSVLQEERLVS
jgi:hypothetical protein